MAAFEVADWAPDAGQLYRGFALRNIPRSELQRLSPGLRVVSVLRNVEGCRSYNRDFASRFVGRPSSLFVVAQKDDQGRINVEVAGDASLFARGQLDI